MINVVAAIMYKEDKIYICKRPSEGVLAGYWEFPGGKIEKGETNQEALKREIMEELGTEVKVLDFIDENIYHYEKFSVNLICYKCEIISGNCKSKIHEEECFEKLSNFDNYNFAPADHSVIEVLKNQNETNK